AMTAVTTTASGIAFGAYDVAIAGGVEHMGHHPMGQGIDPNPRIVAEKLVDQSALIMGSTAENLHDRFPDITKERADAFAAVSQQRVQRAYERGVIQESLVTVATRDSERGWGLAVADEQPRPDTTVEALATLRTPFRAHGGVTAGNAAGLNDGATACLLAAESVAAELGLPAAMRLVSYAFAGVDPEVMGVGPIPATEKALAKAGLSIDDIGAFEINEAFAVQVLAFCDHFELAADDPRLNPYGGAIALGHPLASSGVRLMIHLGRAFREPPGARHGLRGDFGKPPLFEGGKVRADELERLITEASARSEGEVVTHALSRDIKLPHTSGTAVLITLDNGRDHTRPNTLGARGLSELNQALDAALARENVLAIAVTGKPFTLGAGAALPAFPKIVNRDEALAIGRIGHAVYDKLHTSQVPTFAFINGLALGGGLELTLHCHYRTVSAAAPGIALPECFLGLLPGWGGAYLVPNLIGADRAVQLIIENPLSQNKMLTGPEAYQLGLADAIFDGADFLARSLDWAGQIVAGSRTVTRPEIDRGESWNEALARGNSFADSKVFGASPGPYRALELMAAARSADRAAAYRAEDEALGDLFTSPELRARL